MTVEELEIVITTNIQKAMPNIRKVVKEVKNAVNETKGLNADIFKGIDMGKVASDVSKATNTAIKETKKMKEQLKSLGLKDAGDTTGLKIQGIAREITGISNKFKELKGQRGALADVFDASKYKHQAEEMKSINDKVKNSMSTSGYKYDTKAIQNYIDNYKGGNIKKTVVQADTKKAQSDVDKLNSKLNSINGKNIKANIKTNVSSELNKSNTFANKLKNAMQQVKKQIDSTGASSKKISSGLGSAVGSVSKVGGFLQVGLGQILKIAGALFSLRSIYSILSNSARAWLSSQNEQAQQLSANIDYMKYALGSVLAPVIQWIVNLVYQAFKAVQSLIYALTGVNIFANASAKAYSNMAGSAKKAKDETKQLAGVHNEINNIQDNKDSSSGGESNVPNFDLGNIDNNLNSLFQKFKEGKWFETGVNIGKKINEALDKIPWNNIKEKASKIGKGIAEFLNGGIAGTNWNLIGETLAEGINTAINFVYSFVTTFDFKKFGQSIANTINGFIKKIDWKKFGKTISKALSGLLTTVCQFIKTLDWSSVVEAWFTFILNVIVNIDWSEIISTIFYLIGLGWGLQLKAFLTVISTSCELIKEHFSSEIEKAGGNVALGLWNGILTGLGNIGTWIWENVVSPIIEGFKSAMGIHSPSTVMAKLGENVIEGLIKGIKDKLFDLEKRILEICIKIKAWFSNKLERANFIQNGKNIIDGIREGIDKKRKETETTVTNICNNIKTWFNNNIASSKFVQNGRNIIEGMKNGIQNTSAYNTVVSACNNVKIWLNSNTESWQFWKNGSSIIEGIRNGIEGTPIYSTISDICRNISSWFSSKLSKWNFWDIGSNVIEGIKGGMLNTNLASTAAGIAASIATSFRNNLGIHSPSKVMADYVGKFIPLGIAEGIKSQAKSVYKSVNEITEGLKLDKQGLISDISATYSKSNINSNLLSGNGIMERALSNSILNNSNNDRPLQITLNVGNTRLAKILLDDLRNMKRASGKGIEALIGG